MTGQASQPHMTPAIGIGGTDVCGLSLISSQPITTQ